MTSSLDPLYRALDQTWPAAHHIQQDCWCLRVGMGGGKRVSAATLEGTLRTGSIDRAAQSMRDIGQPSLFMIRDNQETLDTELANRGYDICDPSHIYTTPVDKLTTQKPPRVSMFNIWEPLEIQKDIWRQGGIDDARLAVMERAEGEKTSILMRWENHPAGTAFVGLGPGIAMLHALEILSHQRRKGVGNWAMRQAAFWAQKQGAHSISVICTKKNTGANALYSSLNMQLVGGYHYRIERDKR